VHIERFWNDTDDTMGCGASKSPDEVAEPAKKPDPAAAPATICYRVTHIPIKAGSMPDIVKVANSPEMLKHLETFVGFLGVEVLSVGEETMLTCSRWKDLAACDGGAAALGGVLKQFMGEFVAGPPKPPAVGVPLNQMVFKPAIKKAAYRTVAFTFKDAAALEAAMAMTKTKESFFGSIDGLADLTMVAGPVVDEKPTAVVLAGYDAMSSLEAASPKIKEVLMELGPHYAAPPEPAAGTVEWVYPLAAPAAEGFSSSMEAFGAMVGAWGAGEFASLDSPAYAKFFTADSVFDARGAAGLHDIFKTYTGPAEMKEWFDMLATMDMPDISIKFVEGPKSAAGSVVQKYTATVTSKVTGKTTPGPVTDIIAWEFDDSFKVKYAKCYFGQPDLMVYVLEKDAPLPAPQSVMPTPTGVTAEQALGFFGKVYGAWGTGKFNDSEKKQAAFDEMWATDIIMDTTASAVKPGPGAGIYKQYFGHAGGDAWVNSVIGEWEMGGLDMTGEGVVASPTEGAVLHRFTSSIKHKTSGKQGDVLVDYVEWFFNADGKCTGGKFYWGDVAKMAALYPEVEPTPPAVTAFFDGEPLAGKMDKMPELLCDDYEAAFIGPYAGPTTGLIMDKMKMAGAAASLVASFPDFTFNPTKGTPVKGIDGGWWVKMMVSGTFTGAAFTPVPDKLPAIEPNQTSFSIGPEIFTVYPDESGEKIKKMTIEAQSPGALVGPPGIYVACGGKLG
tara:strand:- start:198 stop:2378 length:2181 start_codon:yes stop_codon:yes gene_type:complete